MKRVQIVVRVDIPGTQRHSEADLKRDSRTATLHTAASL